MAKYTQLSYGSRGDEVKKLQEQLNGKGYQLDVDGSYGSATQQAVQDYQSKNNLKVDGIAGDETWGSLNGVTGSVSPSVPSVPGSQSGTQQNTPSIDMQIQDAYQQIVNGKPFSFDMNADAFYKQLKDQYISGGQMAMQDTMGKADGLTGGYGSTYSQQAGQQAFNQYLTGLNDAAMDLEQRAYGRYQDEQEDLWNRYHALQAEKDRQNEQMWAERDWQLTLQQQAKEDAWNKFQMLGTADKEISSALGIPEGTVYGAVSGGGGGGDIVQGADGHTYTYSRNDGLYDIWIRDDGKEISMDFQRDPYSGIKNPDIQYGYFQDSEYWQPNNIGGKPLTMSVYEDVMYGKYEPVYETEDGAMWIWDREKGKYVRWYAPEEDA